MAASRSFSRLDLWGVASLISRIYSRLMDMVASDKANNMVRGTVEDDEGIASNSLDTLVFNSINREIKMI